MSIHKDIIFYKETRFKKTPLGSLPEEWHVITIDEVSVRIKTGPFGSQLKKGELRKKGIKVYTQENVLKRDFSIGNLFIDLDKYEKLKNMEVKPGDVLLTIRGSTGYSVVFPETAKKGIIHTNLAYIRVKKDVILPEYLSLLINEYHPIKSQIITHSSATTLRALYANQIKRIRIPLPPLKEQEIMVHILLMVEELIQKTDEIISKIRRLKNGLLQHLFTKGIGHKEYKETEIGKIPKEWEIVKLGQVAEVKGRIGWHGLRDEDYLKEGNFYLVRGIDFQDGYINWNKCVFVSKNWYERDPNIQLRIGDVLITKDGTIGKVAIINKLPKPATLGTGIFRIRLKTDKCIPEFLLYVFQSIYFKKFVMTLSAGSTLSHLYQRDLINFKFPLPEPNEQRKITEILENTDKKLIFEREKKKRLENLKKGLMDLLLTGKIRVKI